MSETHVHSGQAQISRLYCSQLVAIVAPRARISLSTLIYEKHNGCLKFLLSEAMIQRGEEGASPALPSHRSGERKVGASPQRGIRPVIRATRVGHPTPSPSGAARDLWKRQHLLAIKFSAVLRINEPDLHTSTGMDLPHMRREKAEGRTHTTISQLM